MVDLSLNEVMDLVAAANAARWQSSEVEAERQLDALFGTSHALAVYGTLAPGQPNHHVVAPLGGELRSGLADERRLFTVANLYAAAEAGPEMGY